MKNRVLIASLIFVLICSCYNQSRPIQLQPVFSPNRRSEYPGQSSYIGHQGGYEEAFIWTALYVTANIGYLATEGLKEPFCTGVVVETDGKRPLPGALVMVRIPKSGKMFMVATQKDGSFNINLRKRWTGSQEVQITALAKQHGQAVTITGRENCQDLVLELPLLSEEEWQAFQEKYINPTIAAAKGPMWDVDAQSKEELDSFAKIL